MIIWTLVVFIHGITSPLYIADIGTDRAQCLQVVASYRAPPGQMYGCVSRSSQAAIVPRATRTPVTLPCDTARRCFVLGVAAGEGLPQ